MANVKPSKKQRKKLKTAAHKAKVTKEAQVQETEHALLDDNQSIHIVKPSIQAKQKPKKSTNVKVTGKNATSPEMIQSIRYYLDQWEHKRTAESDAKLWKFKKVKQEWILRWMYDISIVPKSMFTSILAYLQGIEGVARERVLQAANKIIDLGEPKKQEAEQNRSEKLARRKYKRALQVAEALAA